MDLVLSSASDQARLFVKNFSKNSNLDDISISLPAFPSRTNLKSHNIHKTLKLVIHKTLKLVKKVVINFDSSKTRDLKTY